MYLGNTSCSKYHWMTAVDARRSLKMSYAPPSIGIHTRFRNEIDGVFMTKVTCDDPWTIADTGEWLSRISPVHITFRLQTNGDHVAKNLFLKREYPVQVLKRHVLENHTVFADTQACRQKVKSVWICDYLEVSSNALVTPTQCRQTYHHIVMLHSIFPSCSTCKGILQVGSSKSIGG